MHREKPLTSLVTGATAAIIALTGCVLYLVDLGAWGTGRFWPMILASSSATLLVMSLLHSDLQRLYMLLAKREAQAQEEARVDQLTGLANRKALVELLEALRNGPDERRKVLLFLDLNHFKRINDTRGHEGGDELLVAIASRLRIAAPEAFIARLGGDEFAIVSSADDERAAEESCQRISEVWNTLFDLSQGECFVSGSIGAAFLERELTVSALLRRADAAMYRAKSDGVPYRVFDGEMIENVERRARLTVDLRSSFPRFANLRAVFQPIVRSDRTLAGLEALLRWKHPTLGDIPPLEIVSVAEEVQLVNELGLYVAREACAAAKAFPNAVIAFNASVLQLLDSRFEDRLQQLVSAMGVAPSQLQIEVKESDFATRGHDMAGALERLASWGLSIAADDYGSSTSSVVQLKKCGVTVLKLDPRVLSNARETASISVMRAKVELAKALGMTVVCEGVAVDEDRAVALKSGCDLMQGYLFGAPCELSAMHIASQIMRSAA